MKKLTIKVLISVILIFSAVCGLNAQFLNGFYNGAMPFQQTSKPKTDPFRGYLIPSTSDWDGPNPSNSDAYFPILVVFVQFADDPDGSPFNSWPKGQAPTYMNSMIAITKNQNTNTPWWEKYNPETQTLSSQWMEISRGKLHAISPYGSFSVILDSASKYSTESQMNQAIWIDLNRQGLKDWRAYDKWSFNPVDSLFYNVGDSTVDFIYKIHRARGRGPMADHDGYTALAWEGGEGLVDTVNNIKANYSLSGFTVSFRGLKSQYLGATGHEHGHFMTMMAHIQNSRVSYGIGMEGFFSPYDMILNQYMTPRIATFGTSNSLGDYSSRNNNLEGEILKVVIDNSAGKDECFLLANRNKVSKWDRVMLGDSAQIEPYDDNSDLGKGLYIYHVKNGVHFPEIVNDTVQDLECADGYWKWKLVSTGGIAKLPYDCFTSGQVWTVYQKDSVLYSNDPSTLGEPSGGISLGNPMPYGDDVSFFYRDNNNVRWSNRWTTGKFTNQNCGLNIDRINTNDNDIIDNSNLSGDRYDAWKPGYNEVFSPYSSPSTKKWNNEESGIFIWYDSSNGNNANIKIYKVGENGMTESQILAATPPSRPMGIKHEFYYPTNGWCHPKITWNHNMEPDMERGAKYKYKRYLVYRVTASNMSTVPNENGYVQIAQVDIPINVKPHYEDTSVLEYQCADLDQQPPYGTQYPIRYRVVAVDNTDWASVKSDFVSTTGIMGGGVPIGGGVDSPQFIANTPKEYSLSQNYPNPYNPTTKINFALPKQGFVTLKIYDIVGREVQTLVSEVKQAGYYSVDFNGSSLSSGVYFYRIQSSDFVSVKRMVLIK
jgi:Secretion system C-terminal sorting domain